MCRAELRLEVGQEREQRSSDLLLVLAAVRDEVGLVVVGAEAEEEAFEVALPPGELPCHSREISAAAQERQRRGGPPHDSPTSEKLELVGGDAFLASGVGNIGDLDSGQRSAVSNAERMHRA